MTKAQTLNMMVHGLWTTVAVLFELARHLFVTICLVTSIHLAAWWIKLISDKLGTSVFSDEIIWTIELKHVLLIIDLAFVVLLAYHACLDMHRILKGDADATNGALGKNE